MAAGGLLGCGLLVGLIALALSLFGIISLDGERGSTVTQESAIGAAPTATTTDSSDAVNGATAETAPERGPVQATLNALNAAADATFTARMLCSGARSRWRRRRAYSRLAYATARH